MDKKFSLPDWFFFLILIGLSLAFFKVISYFIIDIFIAALLTHLFRKVYYFFCIKGRFSSHSAALASMVLALLFIIIPLLFIGGLLSNEAANAYFNIKQKWPVIQRALSAETIEYLQNRFPALSGSIDVLRQNEIQRQLSQVFSTGAEFVLNLIQRAFLNASFMLFHLVLILILMYFLLMDGDRLIKRILYLSPLKDRDEEELLSEIIKILDATLIGTVIIGLIEGALGGLIFWVYGIPSPLFWGMIMMFFSILPIIGLNLVLVSTAVILMALGNLWGGFIMIILSYGITTITQNYLKPYLVGRRAGLHPAIVLLSTLGGLAWFGLVGFLIGPMIAALFIVIWNQFGQRYQKELEGWNTGQNQE